MIERVLAAKIAEYAPGDVQSQESVLAELLQHYVLVGLARCGFFRWAEFHGGTFLRIVHGIDRFSEDLDFVLKQPDPDFAWQPILGHLARYLDSEGLRFEVRDRSTADAVVKKAFLKTDSIGNPLVVDLPHARDARRKIRIKLEVDTAPPAGSEFQTHYVTFPLMTAITTQTLESAFASKSHALLCRGYVKGRDWYDFLWYAARRVHPNLLLLGNALEQVGPWSNQQLQVTIEWYLEHMRAVIRRIDWHAAAADVRRFLGPAQRETLDQWSSDFFEYHLDRMA